MKKLILLFIIIISTISLNAQIQSIDTTSYTHPIITVTNKHYITSWSQVGSFDTCVVAAGTSMGNGYFSKIGSPSQHYVVVNDGGVVYTQGIAIENSAYIDILGFGTSAPFGFIMDATTNGFALPLDGKSHDITIEGMQISNGINEGITAKIESADLAYKYKCDMTYSTWGDYNLTVKFCKFRFNGGEDWYVNSTGWYGRDPISCPLNDTAIGNLGFDVNHNPTINLSKTLINTTTSIRNFTAFNNTSNTIKETIVKNSGTVSGNIVFAGSNDSSNYTTLNTNSLIDASNVYTQTYSGWKYYRITVNTTSSTMNITESATTQWLHSTAQFNNIVCDSNIFIGTGRSGVNYSLIKNAEFIGNKGWHVGREQNTAQGKLIAASAIDTLLVDNNKSFGSFHDAYWIHAQNVTFTNNYWDSSGYYGTTANSELNPGMLITGGIAGIYNTWVICGNKGYRTHGEGSGAGQTKEFAVYPTPTMSSTGSIFGTNNVGSYVIDPTYSWSYGTDCGIVIPLNHNPVANAGSDITITAPISTTTLNGSATDADGDAITYVWTKISGSGTLSTPNSANCIVTGLTVGTSVFRLTASDGNGGSGTDDVNVIVNAAANTPPTANAGTDIVTTSTTVTLNGSGSDAEGSVTYLWTIISGPNTPTFSNNTVTNPVVSGMIVGVYILQLKVTDIGGLYTTDQVQVTINNIVGGGQYPVIVLKSYDVMSSPSNSNLLDASGSYDSDGNIVSWTWTQVSSSNGFTATLSNANTSKCTVSNLQTGNYTFKLVVVDNSGNSVYKQITVYVVVNLHIRPNSKTVKL